jgi:hypothetical protein
MSTSSAAVALVCSHAVLASVVDPLGTPGLPSGGCLHFAATVITGAGTRKRADHFCGEGLGHITSQLSFFFVVLDHEAMPNLFVEVFSA